MKIGLRFFARGLLHWPANANLSVKFDPIKCQRRVRVRIELLPFFALVIGKKDEPVLVEAFQENNAHRWSAVRSSCGQAHCVDIANTGFNRCREPVSKLFDRIAIKIAPAQTLADMLVTRSIGITWRFHHDLASLAQYCPARKLSNRQRRFGGTFAKPQLLQSLLPHK